MDVFIDIKLKFRGEAKVSWTETESRTGSNSESEDHSVSYSAREEYFKNKFFLVGAEGENIEMICIIINLYFYNNYTSLVPIREVANLLFGVGAQQKSERGTKGPFLL